MPFRTKLRGFLLMAEPSIEKRYIFLAVGLCAFFWGMDAVLDGFLFPDHGSAAFLSASPRELWMRTATSLLVGVVALVVGWRAEATRRTEQAKRHADELSRVLFESARDSICVIDSKELKVTAVNSLFLKRHELTERDALGQSLLHLIRKR